ncbi:hypothetical protein TNCV_4964651 [Trichonephila clavipes]|nr:hypothetical protein TNCV_4964651 [Trichonephila clavipes]
MATPGSSFTPTPLGHEDNLEIRYRPRANTLQNVSEVDLLANRERAVGRLEKGQSVSTVAAALGVSQSVISRLKEVAEGGNTLRNDAEDQGRNTTPLEDVTLMAKRNRNFTQAPDSCKPCNCYRYLCFSKNYLTAINSSWFACTEAFLLHPTSITPSSKEITLLETLRYQTYYKSENILHMQWTAYSLEINRLEHAKDILGRRVAQRTIPLRSAQKLKTTLRQEWDNPPPQGLIDDLVKSMENRCKMCISVHGQH